MVIGSLCPLDGRMRPSPHEFFPHTTLSGAASC